MVSAMTLLGVWMTLGERPVDKGSVGSRQGLLFVYFLKVLVPQAQSLS